MKQHPVRTAFDRIDDPAASDFRKTLRAKLLGDLVAPSSINVVSAKDNHPAQETIVTNTNDDSPSTNRGRRALLGIAAAVVVAIGVTAVIINRNSAEVSDSNPTSVATVVDSGVSTVASGGDVSSQPVTVTGDTLAPFDASDPDPEVGQPAPLISGLDFQGNPVSVDPANGPYMIVFLAHWCPHCNAEIPRLLDWKESGAVPEGLNVIGVATAVAESAPNYPPSEWFVHKQWSWPVMVDESRGEGEAGTAATAYGATGWPYFVIIGADGLVKARVAGEIEISDLQRIVDEALAA